MMIRNNQNRKPSTLLQLSTVAVLLLFGGAFFSRCASVGAPSGGPLDSLAPVVLEVLPHNYSTDFTQDEVIFTFNEYIQLKDQQKELYTSPAMKKKPKLTLRGRSLNLEIEDDSLLENTTYAIEFGATVADNNEGNPLHGFRYVFSTGGSIDSLVMSGYTEDSDKNDSLGRAYIYFFEADSVEHNPDYDSTIFKYQPSKIARSQKNGIFIAQNLKPVDYRIYAFYDSNENQAYEPSIDKIGFLEQSYNPAKMQGFTMWYDSIRRYPSADPQIYLRLFTDESFSRQMLQEMVRPEQHKVVISFGGGYPDIKDITIDGIAKKDIIIESLSEQKDSLALWLNVPSESLPDTLRGSVTYMKHDSVRVLHEQTEPLEVWWRRVETREQERERLRAERAKAKAEAEGREWKDINHRSTFRVEDFKEKQEVNPEEDLLLSFATPLSHFDSTSFELISWGPKRDTVREQVSFTPDSVSVRKWRMHSAWNPEREYRLFIPTGALADIMGEKNDSLTMYLTVSDKAKYATMILDITPRIESAEYIVEFLSENGSVLRRVPHLRGGKHTLNYIPAEEIRIRITEDENCNGKWDAGNMVKRRQSERTELYKNEEGEELFTTKAGWEFEVAMDMNTLFAPISMEELIERLDKREQTRLEQEAERRRKEGNKNKNSHQQGSNGVGGMMSGMGGMMGNFM
jgi:hypothetical protein